MKKIVLLILLVLSARGFSQVMKSDFVTLFNKFPYYKMDRIAVSNVRLFPTDTTTRMGVLNYKRKECDFELDDHAFYIKYYNDSLQHVLSGVHIIPFTKIISLSAEDKELRLYLSE